MENQIHFWSEEEKEYLSKITQGKHYKEIVELMNNKFEYNFTLGQIKSAITRFGLNTGFTGRYEKGHIPANKGKKGISKPNKTSFQKGHIPSNYRPVGSERVNKKGYVEIKVEDPRTWKLKHRFLYEKYHDVKLNRHELIIFADKNNRNFKKENLVKINERQLLILNKEKLIKNDAELTKAGINIAKVIEKINELKNGESKK